MKVAKESFPIAKSINIIFLLCLTSACGGPPYSLNSESDRNELQFDARVALSSGNCIHALDLSKKLFESEYSDNQARMLYASSYGCSAGLAFYDLIDKVGSTDFSTGLFKALVELFPSSASSDSKMQSLQKMQDVLQTVLVPGAIIGAYDRMEINSYNPGSVLYRDRIEDSNVLLLFSSMANIGVSLNRYGNPNPDHTQGIDLLSIWPNKNAINSDPEHASCAIASAMTNFADAVDAIKVIATGPLGNSLNVISISLNLIMGNSGSANAKCLSDGYTQVECDRAYQRLRYRDSCYEADKNPLAISSYAVGILGGIDAIW